MGLLMDDKLKSGDCQLHQSLTTDGRATLDLLSIHSATNAPTP